MQNLHSARPSCLVQPQAALHTEFVHVYCSFEQRLAAGPRRNESILIVADAPAGGRVCAVAADLSWVGQDSLSIESSGRLSVGREANHELGG